MPRPPEVENHNGGISNQEVLALVVCPAPDTTVFAWVPLVVDVSIPVHLWSWVQRNRKPKSEESD